MARKVRYRTSWWQFWRKSEPWRVSFPPPASYWSILPPELEAKRVEALRRVAKSLDIPEEFIGWRDTWPPSWTDEADEPAPADITEWALLDPSPSVPEAEDEDERRQAP